MEPLKSGFSVARAVMPLLYCGGLYYYFSSDTFGGAFGPDGAPPGMSPNMLVIICAGGLLSSFPLILKLVQIFTHARAAGSSSNAAGNDTGGFDPDAAIARYMASKSTEPTAKVLPTRPVYAGSAAKPSGFGRKGR